MAGHALVQTPRALQRVALATAVAAATPYTVLKVLWLAGSEVGLTSESGSSEMTSGRFVAGNAITVALIAVAVGFLVALTRPGARRVPAPAVFVLGAGATGLLAPILLGLPLGLLVQSVVTGEVRPEEQGLAPWVFGVVYAGFGVLAAATAVIVAAHVVERWGHLLRTPPPTPPLPAVAAGAVGMLPFVAAMLLWGVLGPGESGPQGMDLPAQRTVLVTSAVLGLAAFLVPLVPGRLRAWTRTAWLLTWTGCCVVALQGPTQILLAQGGDVAPAVAAIAVLSTPGACLYGLAVLRTHLSARGTADGGSPTDRGSRPWTPGPPRRHRGGR